MMFSEAQDGIHFDTGAVLLMSFVSYRLEHSKTGFEASNEECMFAEGMIKQWFIV